MSRSHHRRQRLQWELVDYPAIPAISWFGVLNPVVLVLVAMPALALLFLPSEILDVSPFASKLTGWLQQHLPGVATHSRATRIPQLALVVDCLVVLCGAGISVVYLVQTTINYRYLYRRHIATGPHRLGAYAPAVVGPPLAIGLIAAMVMIPGDPSWAAGATQDRTLAYSLLASGGAWFSGLLLGLAPLAGRLFLDAYLFAWPITMKSE